MKKIIISTLSVSLLLVVSCQNDFENSTEDVVVTSGDANFSKYISLGNSLTSGYRDGALYSDGQSESYPSMLAQQMRLAGGGDFKQPMMPNNTGGFTNLFDATTGDFSGKYILSVSKCGTLGPEGTAPAAALDNISSAGPYQNLGVPGAKSFHLGVNGYGNPDYLSIKAANPYYVRFATSHTSSVIADALAQSPTFFTLWIGNNDVLSYSTSGGLGTDQTGNTNPTTYGSNDITDPTVFASVINQYVTALTAKGAKGAIANIPEVTSIPYFTTVPQLPISGLTDSQAAQLNAAYAPYNAGILQMKNLGILSADEYQNRVIKFSAGIANGAVMLDKDLKDLTPYNAGLKSYRQTTNKDLIVLTASTIMKPYDVTCNPKGMSAGTAVPLEDKYVLSEKEIAKVTKATNAYNTSLKSIADSKGLAFVDANAKMKELNSTSGIQFDGVKYTASFVTGGTFSLDGVHPTGRGYAIIANEFMKAINQKYHSNLPMINPNSYSGVKFP